MRVRGREAMRVERKRVEARRVGMRRGDMIEVDTRRGEIDDERQRVKKKESRG